MLEERIAFLGGADHAEGEEQAGNCTEQEGGDDFFHTPDGQTVFVRRRLMKKPRFRWSERLNLGPGPVLLPRSTSRFRVFGACLLCAGLVPAAFAGAGLPILDNYSLREMGIAADCWTATQDHLGRLLVGSDGLTVYNGAEWRTYPVLGEGCLRAIAEDPQGRIWVGALDQVGYFTADPLGALNYHSLVPKLPANLGPLDDVWKVFLDGSCVVFVTKDDVLRWDGIRFSLIEMPGTRRLFAAQSGGRIFFQHEPTGLYELVAGPAAAGDSGERPGRLGHPVDGGERAATSSPSERRRGFYRYRRGRPRALRAGGERLRAAQPAQLGRAPAGPPPGRRNGGGGTGADRRGRKPGGRPFPRGRAGQPSGLLAQPRSPGGGLGRHRCRDDADRLQFGGDDLRLPARAGREIRLWLDGHRRHGPGDDRERRVPPEFPGGFPAICSRSEQPRLVLGRPGDRRPHLRGEDPRHRRAHPGGAGDPLVRSGGRLLPWRALRRRPGAFGRSADQQIVRLEIGADGSLRPRQTAALATATTSLAIGADGTAWIGTRVQGLFRLAPGRRNRSALDPPKACRAATDR